MKTGLQQLMCGARIFRLEYITRNDIAALTREASRVSSIPFLMDLDREEALGILEGTGEGRDRFRKSYRQYLGKA